VLFDAEAMALWRYTDLYIIIICFLLLLLCRAIWLHDWIDCCTGALSFFVELDKLCSNYAVDSSLTLKLWCSFNSHLC